MKKVLVLFLGMVMSASMMWADNAPKKVENQQKINRRRCMWKFI